MTTPPDKCPKCGASRWASFEDTGHHFLCGSSQDRKGTVNVSRECTLTTDVRNEARKAILERENFLDANANAERLAQEANRERTRANAEHERAEKWKACAVKLAENTPGASDEDCKALETFEKLMREEN